jgi:hypothetical protein
MGANAQTTVPTFVASQVLTADQMNQSARTGIPVFADTTARDAAFGGTGEKTLAEGQLCYVENLTGVAQIQYYDGAAWVSLASSGLVRISGETAFSAASSVTLDSVFTSTYRNYKLVLNYTTSSTAGVRFRVRASGSSITTTTYNEQELTGLDATASASRAASAQSISVGKPSNGTFNSSCEILICNPQIATPTTLVSTVIYSNAAYTAPGVSIMGGNNSNATAYDGFELFVGSGTTTGNYTLYGLANS